MLLVIPQLHAKFFILSSNIFPNFDLIISALPSKFKLTERLKNDEYGLIYERI